ncbi:unnamed protein product [Cladocopium goreaui]|uniref:Pentacotripeptide-repeat region of PRORP domain-containing protein n=1 Tax=Cladocopium goreaui TaxID=2562237 RepID=A0A9P1C5N7_9DINO|nr:unnamed protein product [Cladocopium goreaui]
MASMASSAWRPEIYAIEWCHAGLGLRPAGPGLRSSLVKAAARTMAWQEALQMAEVEHLELRSLNALLKAVAAQQAFEQALLGAAVATAEWQRALALLPAPVADADSTAAFAACGSALSRQRRWREALQLIEVHGVQDAALLTAVLSALAKERRWQLALKLMKASPCRDLAAHNALLHALGWEGAFLLLAKMETEDLRPDLFSYSATLAACSREMQWQAALQVMQDMSLMSIRSDAICRGAALRALSLCFRWRHALMLASSTSIRSRRPLEVLEVIAACQGATAQSGLQQLLPLRSRLLMLRPHVTLTGRCQGEGEAATLAQSLSDHGLLCKGALGLHMGIRAQLEGRNMARRGPLPALPALPASPRLASSAPAAQFLRTWLAFHLCLGGRRISSPGLWVSGSRRAAATGGSCPRKRDKWRQPAVKVGKCEHFKWSCLKIDLQLEVFLAFFNQPFGGTKHGKLIA